MGLSKSRRVSLRQSIGESSMTNLRTRIEEIRDQFNRWVQMINCGAIGRNEIGIEFLQGLFKIEAEDLTAALACADVREDAGWIPVSERLPEVGVRVEIYDGKAANPTTRIDMLGSNHQFGLFWKHYHRSADVTHWRPLPEPPK